MKRINKKFRNSWWFQWNYSAPLYWFRDWLKKNHKKIYKLLFKGCAIFMGIWLSSALPMVINDVYADFTNHQLMQKRQKEQLEREAIERELAYIKHLREVENEKKRNEKLRQEEEERQKQEIEEEIKSKYGLYSWIEITWWGDKIHITGPDAPRNCSRTGQIKKIDGKYLYGTWGKDPLTYKSDVFHLISKKEYLEIRKKEQLARDREEVKKHKKFKSWGLYPGTVKSNYE